MGDRIRQARVAAGFSLRDLAERAAPLSANAVSRYEQGADIPRPETLQRLARALSVPASYFFRQVTIQLDCPRYRRNSRFGVKAQQSIEERVKEQLERYVEVESLFPPERFDKPGLSQQDRKEITSIDQAEDIAAAIRDRWELGKDAIENIAETLEDRGVKVLLIEAPDGFDGLACWANGEIPVVVANASKHWDRQRFDLAHELGELVLNPSPGVDSERAAHRFAGAFLVPGEVVRRELGNKRGSLHLEELKLLKQEYGLSMQAWIRRALDTQVITETTYRNLFRTFSALGLRKNERQNGEPHREPDSARRFELLVRQAAVQGLITPAREAEFLGQMPAPSRPRISSEELRTIALAARSQAGPTPDDEAWVDFPGDDLEHE